MGKSDIYICSLVAFCIPGAKVISQYGVKKCTLYCFILLFISVLISIFAVNPYLFLLSRGIQGLSCALLSVSIYMLIVNDLEDDEVGPALGIVGSSGYIGMLIAHSFMGFTMFFTSWRTAFLIFIPIILILFFILRGVKKEWTTEKQKIDNLGSLIYVVTMGLLAYGITILDEWGIVLVIASIFLLILFVKVEKRAKHPIYNLKLLKDVRYVIGNYAAMAAYFTTTIAFNAITFYLLYIEDYSEYFIGLILLIAPIIMVGLSGFSGRLTKRVDPRIISGVAMAFIFTSMILYAFMDHFELEYLIFACILQGIGAGLFSAPNNKYVLTLVDVKDLPDASSLLSTNKEFGKILSGGIYTLIFSIFIVGGQLGDSSVDYLLILSTHIMMIINAIVAFVAMALLFYSYTK
ncbi:MAG: MFS transporter [Methanobrevibacter sp.]|nr:MFS transporter [Methanobrevibacter sp.]